MGWAVGRASAQNWPGALPSLTCTTSSGPRILAPQILRNVISGAWLLRSAQRYCSEARDGLVSLRGPRRG